MASLSLPTTVALPHSQRVPSSNPLVTRILYKLSRPSLLSLVLDWLDESNQRLCFPYLVEDDEEDAGSVYPAVQSLDELRGIYEEMQQKKGGKRDVVDRMIEGDWREGLSLYQLAMADLQYLYDHPLSQKWTALKVVRINAPERIESDDTDFPSIPRFHPSTFLRNIQREMLPDVKAHCNLDRPKGMPLLLLRIYVLESPYNTSLALNTPANSNNNALDASKTIYIAFPDNTPHIYISLAAAPGTAGAAADTQSLRQLVLAGIPKAFSKPRARYGLETTNMSARNLRALLDRRGSGNTNAAGGGWTVYAEESRILTPLNTQLPSHTNAVHKAKNSQQKPNTEPPKTLKRKIEDPAQIQKRRKLLAEGRFGKSAKPNDKKGIERFDVRLDDASPRLPSNPLDDESLSEGLSQPQSPLPQNPRPGKKKGRRSTISLELEKDDELTDETAAWRPEIRLTFHGSHVFAGIRALVEEGVVDGRRMPGWMTGDEGVSVGVVKDGRIRNGRGGVL